MRAPVIMTSLAAAIGLLLAPAASSASPPSPAKAPTSGASVSFVAAPESAHPRTRSGSPHRPGSPVRRSPSATPLVISHRGASGYRPEHTAAAYELAVQMGADYIEPDLVMSRDGVLIDRHEPEIGGTTDVAEHPEFADRRTTKSLDGVATTGWFAEDFTLAELKTLRAKERLGQIRDESSMYDGRFEILTFEEGLRLREQLARRYGRPVGIIPEIKHSTYLHAQGLDPEAALVALTRRYGLNRPTAPMWVQSFELGNLIALRERHGYRANLTFLTTVKGAPYDLVAAGDSRTYADLTAPASLRRLARTLDGIGPEKDAVIARTADGRLGSETGLVDDAHAAGLTVTPWTFRAENQFLPVDYRRGSDPAHFGRAVDEALAFMRAGVDGVFCDQPDVCVQARRELATSAKRAS